MAEFLPLELNLLILEACSDTDTLRSCCSVCRSWLSLSQFLLFRRTNVLLGEENPALIPSYLRLHRRSSQQLVPFIQQADGSMRRLIKNIDITFDKETKFMSLLGILPLLENLQSLTLQARFPQTTFQLSPCCLASAITLTRLVLVSVTLGQFDKDVASLPNLRELSLKSVFFSEWSQASATDAIMSSAVPQLRELSASITRRSFDALVEHLLPHMIALRRLVVHIFDDRHSSHDALDHLIALNTETLEHLATHHMVPSLPLPRLCTLSLSSGQGIDVFLIYVRDILTFIRSITTSMLEELVLRSSAAHLLSHLHSHSAQWDGLQDLILSVAWQCRLVVCTLENVSDELSDLQMHPSFERLRAAGRITFVGKSIRDFQRMEE